MYYWLNIKNVERRIFKALLELSNDSTNNKAEEASVPFIVRLAGGLALEFGAQRHGLGLTFLKEGDSTLLGVEFVDYHGMLNSSTPVRVGLTVSPSMFKIGDGDSDLQSRRTMVSGQVYLAPVPWP